MSSSRSCSALGGITVSLLASGLTVYSFRDCMMSRGVLQEYNLSYLGFCERVLICQLRTMVLFGNS